jgi:hypothetical protein
MEKLMNETLMEAVVEVVERAKAAGKSGKCAEASTMNQLVNDTGGRIPRWYVELLVGYPLGGLEFGWQAEEPNDDYDGIDWLAWSDPDNIRSESLECYPGLAILEKGWINVASDSMGGGDPYFIPTDQGDDPPVYQVYHDASDKAEVILAEGCRLVAASLSALFQQAIV